jgi:2-haloacid dehalogenase
VTERYDTLLFDVNETLLDLRGLRPGFEAVFGSAAAMGEWFARMLHGSLVSNHLGRYRTFGEIGADALLGLARKRGLDVDEATARGIVDGMRTLPPHPDVLPALERLSSAGYRMAALTNGSTDVLADQLASSGAGRFITEALSVDMVQRFKPAPEVYLTATTRLGADIDRTVMIAAHDWDVVGASSVGIDGAYIDRPSMVWSLPERPPAIMGPDLGSVADQLIA